MALNTTIALGGTMPSTDPDAPASDDESAEAAISNIGGTDAKEKGTELSDKVSHDDGTGEDTTRV
jgi:hypothetical protein